MKILCDCQYSCPDISVWVEELITLDAQSFLQKLQDFQEWPFQRLDDLSCVSLILDKIDSLITLYIEESNTPLLSFLLDKTLLILKPVSSKTLYNSVSELIQILDFPSYPLIYKALKIVHCLVNRVNPGIKPTKAHGNEELIRKLYIIGLGSNLNCSDSGHLTDFADINKLKLFDFIYNQEEMSKDLLYVRVNRGRLNSEILEKNQENTQLALACQLLSLSCLMQINPSSKILLDFCRTLPEIWLLPGVNDLLKLEISPEVHIQALNLLSGVLVMLEGQNSRQEITSNHLISSTHTLLASEQQHGLLQTLLRDLAGNPSILSVQTIENNEFIESLLHLAHLIADYKYRVDSSHVSGMTCSLIKLIQKEGVSNDNKAKGVRVLSVVTSHAIEMFKVMTGLEVVMKVLVSEISEYNERPTQSKGALIRALLRLLKIVSTKWDSSHILGHAEVVYILFDSGFSEVLNRSFELNLYDIYEPSLQLVHCFVEFYKQMIVELNSSGLLRSLLVSLDNKLPNNSKLISVISKFLVLISENDEIVPFLAEHRTIERILEALGSGINTGLTTDRADGIGENLQTLLNKEQRLVDQASSGCVSLVRSIEALDISKGLSKETFFSQLTNIGKILSYLFNFSQTVLEAFFNQKGLESYLNIFNLEVLPITFNNEYHSFAACMKSVTSPSSSQFFIVLISRLHTQLDKIETYLGPFSELSDFSHVPASSNLIHLLTAADCYIEMVRYLLPNLDVTLISITDTCLALERLSDYMRVLISEQARLSSFSKPNDKTTKVFNQPINIQEIENVSLKSFEENFYFTCQLTVRKLYRFMTTRMTNQRGRTAVSEKIGLTVSITMGGILAKLIKLLDLDSPDQRKAYYFCLQLSDILKILLQDQNSNPYTIVSFHNVGGTHHIYKFLLQLRDLSSFLNNQLEKSYDLVNSLQILWNLCGKFLEVLASGRYSSASSSPGILKDFGFDNIKQVNNFMQNLAQSYLKGLNYLECGLYSTSFAKSILDILKSFSDIDKVEPDAEVIQQVVSMGFPEQSVVDTIRFLNTLEIEKIIEFITSGKECFEDQSKIENLHVILINSLPAVPSLKSIVSEILLKICVKSPLKVKEIVEMLTLELGVILQGMLGEHSLLLYMKGRSSIDLVNVAPDYDQLSAVISVISYLVHKSSEVLSVLNSMNFTDHLVIILNRFCFEVDFSGLRCLSALFSLTEGFCKKNNDVQITRSVCSIIKAHQDISLIDHNDLASLITLLTTLTADLEHARVFIESAALSTLLKVKTSNPDEKSSKPTVNSFCSLIKQLVEDPYILQGIFQVNILQNLKPGTELKDFLKLFAAQISRSKEVFQSAFDNTCRVRKEGKKYLVDLNKDKKEILQKRWNTVSVIAEALCEVFEQEQKDLKYLMSSQSLILLLSEVLQSYPVLIKDLLGLKIAKNKKFLTVLIKNIIPFRYSLQINDGKLIVFYPGSSDQVPADVYQSWIKSTSRLVRSLLFKQSVNSYSQEALEAFNSVLLDNNHPVFLSRVRIFKELKNSLQKIVKKQWLENNKYLAIVRAFVLTVVQLLKENPKPPFSSNNSTEIAKGLISEQINMVKLLSDLAKGVNIAFPKAGTLLNLILAPLDLLTKYNMSFTLHSGKPEEPEEPEDDLEKFEILEAGAEFNENQSSSHISIEVDNDIDESESNQSGENIAQDEEEDDEDLLEESDQADENIETIQIQERNTETFWAESPDEDPALNILSLQADEFSAEPDIVDPVFQINNEEIWQHHDMSEEPVVSFLSDLDQPEPGLMQMMIRRNRMHSEVSDWNKNTEDCSLINDMYNVLSMACPVPTPAESLDLNPSLVQSQPDLGQGLDPEFLLSIPEDLRDEISQTKPKTELDNTTFIISLTPDLRQEILVTANEEFLNSLTPELAAEARVLQERAVVRRQPNGRTEEGKVINEIIADEKLSATLASVEDSFLEVLVKSIYLLNPINRDIFASLLLNLSAQASVRGKVLDALVCLLGQFESGREFPPQRLYGSDSYLENYSQVYAIVSGRVLDVLLHLTEKNGKVANDLLVGSKYRLGLIKGVKGNEEISFADLLRLTQHKLFEQSTSHLTALIDLLFAIIEKANEVPAVDIRELKIICDLFRFNSLTEPTVKVFVDFVTGLVKNQKNRSQVSKLLYKSFTLLGKEIANNLKKQETSKDGLKELHLLRIFKVFRVISEKTSSLDYIWTPLTEILTTLTHKDSEIISTANPTLSKLLPLIETFFLSHIGQSSNESFQKFCDKHRRVLNILVKQNPSLLQETFKTLVTEFPGLLDFENKRSYFRAEIRKLRPERNNDLIRLQVRRSEVFEDSFHQLKVRTPTEMHGKLRVSFIDEDGVDAGGLTREWYGLLAREMFNPNYALFIPSANGVSFQPNCMSSINAEHLDYFKFIGRIIGKALCDGYSLDVYFTRSFYKHILGQPVDYHDMEDLDPDFFKNLKMLMDINLNENDIHEYYFAIEEEEFGSKSVKELEPGGLQKRVTEENKMEYIKLICHMKMTANISSQINSFLEGFHELVPKPMIAIFDSKELELLISGLPEIDIDDLRSNTEYHNFTRDSPVILWLWEILFEFSHEEKAEFLQFVTGSSKVPLEGFKALQGMNGVQKFQIHKSFTGPDRLPTAHTCMNQIDLPEYPSKEILRNRIKLAITEGKEGFGFM